MNIYGRTVADSLEMVIQTQKQTFKPNTYYMKRKSFQISIGNSFFTVKTLFERYQNKKIIYKKFHFKTSLSLKKSERWSTNCPLRMKIFFDVLPYQIKSPYNVLK